MLRDTVVDGTPCQPGSRDVCINGKCRVSILAAFPKSSLQIESDAFDFCYTIAAEYHAGGSGQVKHEFHDGKVMTLTEPICS